MQRSASLTPGTTRQRSLGAGASRSSPSWPATMPTRSHVRPSSGARFWARSGSGPIHPDRDCPSAGQWSPVTGVPFAADLGLAGGGGRHRHRPRTPSSAGHPGRGGDLPRIWLAPAFAAVLMVVDVLGGPTFDPRPAAIAGVMLLLAGLVLAALSNPSRPLTARMLDRTFGLQERLSTALDDLGLGVPAPGERAPVVYLQMADAANAIAALRSDSRLRPVIPCPRGRARRLLCPGAGDFGVPPRSGRRFAGAGRGPRAAVHPRYRTTRRS